MKDNKNSVMSAILDWIIYSIGYALILILMSLIFKKTVQIDNSYFGLWAFLASLLIRLLNRTIKPVLVWLTIPITALTLGIFYPFINVIILKIVSFILGNHFNVNGIFTIFFVAILISILNQVMDEVIKNLLEKR